MEIVDIFADQLFAFHYKGEVDNEYDRLMEDWTDVVFLRDYAKKNGIAELDQFVKNRLKDAEDIQDLLEEITTKQQSLGSYFQPFHNSEIGFKLLSLQKGKTSKKDGLRLYAIKIDENEFVITGGCIKMGQATQEHKDMDDEVVKLKSAQDFLKKGGVVDIDSFYEFKDELQ
jgi:hypothetical protein